MHASVFPAISRRILHSKIACFAIAAFFLLVYVAAHFRAGMSFPCPWPDEADFLWQAIAFAETWGLTTPVLHPTRPILWMPPGYMVMMGLVGKIVPLSLVAARSFSLVCMMAAFILMIFALRTSIPSPLATVLIGFYWLSDPFVVTGNIGRMEAPLLVLLLSGYLLLRRGHFWKALALFAAAPLIHPNGLFFTLVCILCGIALCKGIRMSPRFTQSDAIFLSPVLMAWLLYGGYIGIHWGSFLADMAFQMERKQSRGFLTYWQFEDKVFAALCIGIACQGLWTKCADLLCLVALAIPCWLAWKLGEMWYDVFGGLSNLLMAAVLLRICLVWLPTTGIMLGASRSRRWTLQVCCLVWVAQWIFSGGMLTNPDAWLEGRYWRGLSQSRIPYMTDSDKIALQEHLKGLKSLENKMPVIEFFPRADSLIFKNLHGKSILISQPLFYDRIPDYYIVHISQSLPQGGWGGLVDSAFRRAGIDASKKGTVVFQRDETEIWHIVRAIDVEKDDKNLSGQPKQGMEKPE